jgi:hypothetical protein
LFIPELLIRVQIPISAGTKKGGESSVGRVFELLITAGSNFPNNRTASSSYYENFLKKGFHERTGEELAVLWVIILFFFNFSIYYLLFTIIIIIIILGGGGEGTGNFGLQNLWL